ncbi:MAG: SDR family oxidoreductase [Chlorobi bacterium]|nr:SDR family oxidoreductase [Chlorobiota bacterium]
MAKTVLITGAAGGLGIHVTQTFAEHQWHIIATVLNNKEREHLTDIARCTVVECDVTTPESVESLQPQLPNSLDAVVHLVGGIAAVRDIEETTHDDFYRLWKLNTLSTYLLLRATVPLLKQSAGAFIAIGARAVAHPEPQKALYAATKAALVQLVLTVAEEGRPFGMRANVILPSIIRTPANLQWAPEGEEQRWVPPDDIAQCIYALCSDSGRGVTGCIIPMYGKIPA